MDEPQGTTETCLHKESTFLQNGVTAKQRSTIQKHFKQPVDEDRSSMQAWFEKYAAADGNALTLTHELIQEVEVDELGEEALENCINELAQDILVANGFCEDCQNLFDNWPDLGDPEVKDPTTEKNWPGSGADWKHVVARDCHTLVLEASARKGCRFCAFLLQMAKDAELLDTMRKIELRLERLQKSGTSSLSVQNWGWNTSQILWLNFPDKVCNHCNSGIAQDIKFESAAIEVPANTYDEHRDVLDIVKGWIEECVANHKDCVPASEYGLPTRLISVAGENLRLVLTSGWKTKPRYSTLSHRWGSDSFLQLTAHNYSSFIEEIPFESLPLTFKDAVNITRQLGLEYLWIDSLCIIQGDLKDWRREAGAMSSVYGGSFINIAAASAVDVHGGCLSKLPNMVDGLRASIKIKEFHLVREFRSSDVYNLSTTRTHLATRAWALQEKLLPARTIHFGHRGAFWECRETTANEYLPDGFVAQLGSHLNNLQDRQGEYLRWWDDVVRLYSAADLTFPRDKLPALSGVAKQVYKDHGDQYCAGLWKNQDLEAQLCWRIHDPRPKPSWRAPSWSWASVDGGASFWVRQEDIMERGFAHVLDVDLKFVCEDKFGEVSGGCLRMVCSGMLAAEFQSDSAVTVKNGEGLPDRDRIYPIKRDSSDAEYGQVGDTVYLLPIIGGKTGAGKIVNEEEESMIDEYSVCGIVLKSTADPGRFHRVGYFEFRKDWIRHDDDPPPELYEPFLKLFEQNAKPVAENVCLEIIEGQKNLAERYVIEVV